MGEYRTTTISDIIKEYVNRNTFLPAIQRKYVWNTYQIEKLFDSLMCNYPISSFLFWKIREEKKKDWIAYEFIKDYDAEDNTEANLDGQQRMTSQERHFIPKMQNYNFDYFLDFIEDRKKLLIEKLKSFSF